jgi:hypothetical protein
MRVGKIRGVGLFMDGKKQEPELDRTFLAGWWSKLTCGAGRRLNVSVVEVTDPIWVEYGTYL